MRTSNPVQSTRSLRSSTSSAVLPTNRHLQPPVSSPAEKAANQEQKEEEREKRAVSPRWQNRANVAQQTADVQTTNRQVKALPRPPNPQAVKLRARVPRRSRRRRWCVGSWLCVGVRHSVGAGEREVRLALSDVFDPFGQQEPDSTSTANDARIPQLWLSAVILQHLQRTRPRARRGATTNRAIARSR